MTTSPTFLTLPGLFNSGDKHWQTHWERHLPDVKRVEQQDWDTPRCEDWVETLDKAVVRYGDNVVLLAHSLACPFVSRWAERHPRKIAGASLVAPSDIEAPTYPKGSTGFTPIPLKKLPFRSLIVVSRGDDFISIDRARQFADAWGSELTILEGLGHIGSDADLGMWPQGLALLNRFAGTSLQA